MFRYAIAALALLCMLTACDSTSSLRELRTAQPTGDAYQKALAIDYRGLAQLQESRYDWWTSKYFADKGLMAAYGRDIEPENPANWDIPKTQLPEFTDARAKLMDAIANNRSTQPDLTASGVVAYDEWVEVAHNQNKWDAARIEEQRDAFFAVLTKLSEVHTAEPGAVAAPATPGESTSTILYFPLNSDHLGESANAAMAELVRYIQSAGNVTVTINGHTDRSGSESYNMKLSERRAKFVMEALKAAGVPENIMKYFAFGETDPAVPTADGVKEPKNRRVEIFFE
jgi:OOP family OmpA-OmpF porin